VEEETVEDEDKWYDHGDWGEKRKGSRTRRRTRTSTIGECGGEEPLEGEAASCIFSS
jgi:hypothetical protein